MGNPHLHTKLIPQTDFIFNAYINLLSNQDDCPRWLRFLPICICDPDDVMEKDIIYDHTTINEDEDDIHVHLHTTCKLYFILAQKDVYI